MKAIVRGDIAKVRHKELTALVAEKNYQFRKEHRQGLEVLLEQGREGLYRGFDQYFNRIEIESEEDLSSNWVLLNDIRVTRQGNSTALMF